ncbi:hypothetical protein B9Z55_021275 [Caenorhabditis nigoni]|uniref:F-box domain-containing protein n=1 Tax=Caenorhabditis nigoni TaxID=1611254 RepID=A0A2G5TR69_9PELO|nr:hypothetical protein B9Z55_021275 [Caenorhabditis nigoni]
MSSLSEMPELVMENIIRLSDFLSVQTLRRVCRDFRNFIDDLNDSKLPDSKFHMIEIVSDKQEKNILTVFVSSDISNRVKYSETDNSRNVYGKITTLENSNIVDAAYRDLEAVLKFQKSTLKLLFFSFFDLNPLNDSERPNSLVKLGNMLKELNRKIKTELIFVSSGSQTEIMSIMPLADPDTLESLKLFSHNDIMEIEIDEIVKTEHVNIEDICHCPIVFMKIVHISANDLDFLKKVPDTNLQHSYHS